MAITLDRKSPGLFEILFGLVLSLVLGALLAVIFYISKPVEVVTVLPKEPVEGVRYYVEGVAGSGSTWERKAAMVEAGGGEISFTEAELNAWSNASFETAKVDEASKADTAMLIMGKPNFRIDGNSLQVGLVNQLVFFGTEKKLVLQAKGSFTRKANGWAYVPDEIYLGGLPLHKIPALADVLTSRLTPAAQIPASVKKVLAQATAIVVTKDAVAVGMP